MQPALGRLLDPGDDRSIGESPVAVLSHAWWLSRFGADPNVLNDTIIVNGQSLTIVGVAPRDFTGTTLGATPQVFVPITLRGILQPGFKAFEDRRNYWVYSFARLKPGVSLDQAKTAINVPYQADRERRRSAAPEGHERPDDGPVQGQGRRAWRKAGAGRARSTAKRERRCCSCSA